MRWSKPDRAGPVHVVRHPGRPVNLHEAHARASHFCWNQDVNHVQPGAGQVVATDGYRSGDDAPRTRVQQSRHVPLLRRGDTRRGQVDARQHRPPGPSVTHAVLNRPRRQPAFQRLPSGDDPVLDSQERRQACLIVFASNRHVHRLSPHSDIPGIPGKVERGRRSPRWSSPTWSMAHRPRSLGVNGPSTTYGGRTEGVWRAPAEGWMRRRYSKRTLPGAVIRRSSGRVRAMMPKATARPIPIRA